MVENNEFKYMKTPHIPELTILDAAINTFKYKRHSHEDFAIGVTINGSQCFYCSNEFVRSKKGSIMQINPNELHDGFAEDENGYSYYMLYIPQELFFNAVNAYFPRKISNFRFDKTVIDDGLIRVTLLQLISEIKQAKAGRLTMEELFLRVIEAVVARNEGFQGTAGGNKKDPIIIKAMEFIHENLNNKINLDDICKAVSISKYHFVRLFRNYTGRTPYQYILDCKIETVRKAIESGAHIGSLVSDYCFYDIGHFNRRFKEVYGITPYKYQQSL